jgi:Flp pilus assembly protein TadD
MTAIARAVRITALLLALTAGGCATEGEFGVTGAIPPSDQRPSDEDVLEGKKHFAAGNYGLAERHFRAAVEANPKSAPGWLGLAASYDRLSRFDLAERAYEHTLKLQGRTPAVLNNLGYHYMLRGQLAKARATLDEAARLDPASPHIQGNLALLATWKTGERPPGLDPKDPSR